MYQTMANKTRTIYFGHITSFGKSGFNSSAAIPAVDLAMEHINNNTSILPGYKLMSTPVMDSGVSCIIIYGAGSEKNASIHNDDCQIHNNIHILVL